MVGAGFEPAKAEPTGLQPVPFDRSGTPPGGGKSSAARRAGSPAAPAQDSRRVAEALGLGERLELLQRVVLDLADPLARDVERAADLLERERARAGEAEAHLDHLALALRERVERAADVLLAEVLRRRLERRDRGLILDEVAQL